MGRKHDREVIRCIWCTSEPGIEGQEAPGRDSEQQEQKDCDFGGSLMPFGFGAARPKRDHV